MNVAVGVILTRKMTVSEVLYWTVVGPIGDNKPTYSTDVAISLGVAYLRLI